MNEKGDITVIGNVAGIHLLEDIGVTVPCNEEVHIRADQVIRSRDLQIALQRRQVRRASREAGVPSVGIVKKPQPSPPPPPPPSPPRVVAPPPKPEPSFLEEENRRLRLELQETRRRLKEEQDEAARQKFDGEGFQRQLNSITAALERLESRPTQQVVAAVPQDSTSYVPKIPSVRVIEDDTPAFIQDMNVQADDLSIEIEPMRDSGESVVSAAKKLKSLREKKSK